MSIFWVTPEESERDLVLTYPFSMDNTSTGRQRNMEPFFVMHNPLDDRGLQVVGRGVKICREAVLTKESIVEKLKTCADADDFKGFQHMLMCYLCEVVPTLFVPNSETLENLKTPTLDIPSIRSLITCPLQLLMRGQEGKEFYKTLAATDTASGTCNRVFKPGESTYSCRDCGADPTCVLCNDCFNRSSHKQHRYKISTSTGGGYCDCGDDEAWTKDPFCLKHLDTSSPAESTLKPQEQKLGKWIMDVLLLYADGVLSNDFAIVSDSIPLLRDSVGNLRENILSFSLLVYNDEIHTFDNVIDAIVDVLAMHKKDADDFTHKIHLEGRAVITTGTFDHCSRLKRKFASFSRKKLKNPLRVQIQQSALVAHQYFAEYILHWITKLLNASASYRKVFHSLVWTPMAASEDTMIQMILKNDMKPWKQARTCWHHLLIAGLLKEYNVKKDFATLFADSYVDLMTEFSQDDQDHGFSLLSLTVQLFTVPSLAHHLMERGLFFNIMRAVLSEVEPLLDSGKIQFKRIGLGYPLRRTQFCLLDLKYLLTSAPPNWTPNMRREFAAGFSSLVKFCVYLQESDPVVRQLGDHVEYEAEWEVAFNTHNRLAPLLTLVCLWSATDFRVQHRCYRNILQEMSKLEAEAGEQREYIVREVANHSATCWDYDVAHHQVSIYLALTRLFVTMYLVVNGNGLTPQQLEPVLEGIVRPSPEYILEGPLRTLALVSQRFAGMWTRNGFSLLNQIYFYQNVRCRSDMYDKDILALQIASTQMESNEFLIHVMNKYNILEWMEEAYDLVEMRDENLGFTVLLVEEFLLLLLTLINARYIPGVGDITRDDCIRKQIIQFLCMGPMTHSELNRHLEEDLLGETQIENVVTDVAVLKKTANGDIYELQPEFYAEYDVFYNRYVREEIFKTEEVQRERKLGAKEIPVFPPPALPRLTKTFTLLINFLQADVLMHVIQTVLKRFLKIQSRSFSDSQLKRVLHLIAYGLNEELENRKTDPIHFFQFAEALGRWEIVNLLKTAVADPRAMIHKEMILWLIRTHAQLRPSSSSSSDLELLQQQEEDELALRKQKAAAARARSMASMSNLQMKFKAVNADLLQEYDDAEEACASNATPENVCLGPERTAQMIGEERICCLCKDRQGPSSSLVVGCFIQRSHTLAQKTSISTWTDETLFMEGSERTFFVRPDLLTGLFMATCGHVMHKGCRQQYHENVVTRHIRRLPRQLEHIDEGQNETVCPMCERLHNIVISVLPPLNLAPVPKKMSKEVRNLNFENWLCFLSYTMKRVHRNKQGFWNVPLKREILKDEQEDSYALFWSADTNMPTYNAKPLPDDDILNRIRVESKLPSFPTEERPDVTNRHIAILELWNLIAYTITSYELSMREQGMPLFGDTVPYSVQVTMKYLTRLGAAVVNTKESVEVVAAQLIAFRNFKLICNAYNRDEERIELTAIDSFSLLVTATYSFPFAYAKTPDESRIRAPQASTVMDDYIFKTVFFLHMTQLLTQQKMVDVALRHQEYLPHNALYPENGFFERYCRRLWGLPSVQIVWADILALLEELVIPFVTCCCKFYECYTSIEFSSYDPQNTSLSVMLKYLGQETDLKDFFQFSSLLDSGYAHVLAGKTKPNIFPRSTKSLISLPVDYIQLINFAANFTCGTKFAYDGKYPTLCLVCGKLLCSQSSCCTIMENNREIGGCALHTRSCGSGSGIFLRIRDCKAFILTSFGKKGAYVHPPYVDAYGETDQGLRRGNPLHFAKDKYDHLHKLWIDHSIPEEVRRSNERLVAVTSVLHVTNWSEF